MDKVYRNFLKLMFFFRRRLFSDKKTKLVYLNGPNQVHLSCPIKDSKNGTAYKIFLKLSTKIQKTQASQGRCCKGQ